ncbi:TPA: hypothetical protein HA265_07590 [Candidatus Woesearchaeota archaeon]|nr:hypothetical protein [Candidatus Woesearchaeota archaeon]
MSDSQDDPMQDAHVLAHYMHELETSVFVENRWGDREDKLRIRLFKESGDMAKMEDNVEANPYWHKRTTHLGVLYSYLSAGYETEFRKAAETYIKQHPSAEGFLPNIRGEIKAADQTEEKTIDQIIHDLEQAVFVRGDWDEVAQQKIEQLDRPGDGIRLQVLGAAWSYRKYGMTDKYRKIAEQYAEANPSAREFLGDN